ncbi:MAG: type I 3-dehydroquinate dehydratase [Treponema sp.]|jgi:3-dehydroquinate dehydratase/shikimate dehydrogenase|nr:type I 3-dehydroquinate dehydratase [Treponema sp.]
MAKICLCLTGETLEENLLLLNKYRPYIDMVELRADYLTKDEQLQIRKFPAMTDIPCILTIRRTIDGGQFSEGEARRTTLFARALAFAEQDTRKNYAYIDLEEDFNVPSLLDAAMAFGTRVIRSFHSMNEPVKNIAERMKKMRTTGYEIPKIACMPRTLDDVTDLFRQSKEIGDFDHILVAMESIGLPTRILANKLKNFLTYVSPIETAGKMPILGHLDPITLNEMYNFRTIDNNTCVFGITGYPLNATSSPKIHNKWFKKYNMNAVFIPIRAHTVKQALAFCEEVNIGGLSVTVPHKESIIEELHTVSAEVNRINACNTVVRRGMEWAGYNTDAFGFERSLCEFLGTNSLARKKVSIIGSGGAAKAVAYVIKKLHGKACVFNRTVGRARQLAEYFGFKYAALGAENMELIKKYSDVIIQTTSVGMDINNENFFEEENNPLYFYKFSGKEAVYDVIYVPNKTPFLTAAEKAGCRICNGLSMLEYQAEKQFALYTGKTISHYEEKK